ncbi:hypothetical protein IGI92_003151 [Enterococcus sp. DIV2379]|uniref:hypothetical protein n=1 Tax=Enterococcus sp. DIV2379 TaxID=2774684 RepID=UPI003D2FFA1F
MNRFFNKISNDRVESFNNLKKTDLLYVYCLSILYILFGIISILIEKSFFFPFLILNIISLILTILNFIKNKKTVYTILLLNYLDMSVGDFSMKSEKFISKLYKINSNKCRVNIFRGISILFSAVIAIMQIVVLLRTFEYTFTGREFIVNYILKITSGDLLKIKFFFITAISTILIINLTSYLIRDLKNIIISEKDYFKLKNIKSA